MNQFSIVWAKKLHKQLFNNIKFTPKDAKGNYTIIPTLNNKRLSLIDVGAFKKVYFLSKQAVLKICRDDSSFDLEIKKYRLAMKIDKTIVAKILAHDKSNCAIIQERVSTNDDYINQTNKKTDKRRLCSIRKVCTRLNLFDVKLEHNFYRNIGVKRRKLVIYDFGV